MGFGGNNGPTDFKNLLSFNLQAKSTRMGLYLTSVGAGIVSWLKTYFTAAAPEAWLFVLGGLFVLTTLFLPRGIVGALARVGAWRPPRPTPILAPKNA